METKRKSFGARILFAALTLLFVATAFMLPGSKQEVRAENSVSINGANLMNRDPNATINDTDRQSAYTLIIEYMNSLKALYDLSDASLQRMDEVFYQANVYIANSHMTVGELISYVSTVKANLATAAGGPVVPSETSRFLFLVNEVPAASVRYGQQVTLELSLVNLAKETVTDVVVTPKISTKVSEWPFVITNASDVRMIASISAGTNVEDAYAKRQNLTWTYTVAQEALTGTYPLTFHVQYYRNGNIEECDLTTYISITGKSSNGELNSEGGETQRTSTPRIIVTGFSTDPEMVNAGDTFNLTVTVQNTSSETPVSNIQFDLKADQVGSDNSSAYEAFLPTSGSATIYVSSIPAGESKDISIEMTARNDLAQKPYVVTVHALYEDKDHNPYEANTNVSIPVYQIAKIDTGADEIMPESIPVGGVSNVMFSVYNVGKTTLYNVRVSFEGDSISCSPVFLGKIEPNGTGNVDVMVNGIAPTGEEEVVTAIISYEDEAGEVTTYEKAINLYVYEEYYEEEYYGDESYGGEYYGDEYYGEDMGAGSGISGGVIAAIVIGAIVVVTFVILVIVKVNKKKKLKKEQQELEDFIS